APEEREEIESLRGKKVILAVNKIDLNPAAEGDFDLPAVRLSAETGEGVEDLRNMIFDLAGAAEIVPGSAAVANLRHKNALKGAAESLENASETLRSDVPLDLISADVREALLQTGLILGDACGEDLLERIFSDFCIGK
ncbi:MAG: tRNA uridine-5-carboxymethylaminomethyl(34) synthesis GTPase MnmE, partial [Abditibacteriota bacterium]|nr:tRNA uridine-5-carboxymethylaminomethyl(34) synthesis GTPase MnmE [Abditibacteriota bacterium]